MRFNTDNLKIEINTKQNKLSFKYNDSFFYEIELPKHLIKKAINEPSFAKYMLNYFLKEN